MLVYVLATCNLATSGQLLGPCRQETEEGKGRRKGGLTKIVLYVHVQEASVLKLAQSYAFPDGQIPTSPLPLFLLP